jgi:hypothetical protein
MKYINKFSTNSDYQAFKEGNVQKNKIIHLSEQDMHYIVKEVLNEGRLSRFLSAAALGGALLSNVPAAYSQNYPNNSLEQTIEQNDYIIIDGQNVPLTDIETVIKNIFNEDVNVTTNNNEYGIQTKIESVNIYNTQTTAKETTQLFTNYFLGMKGCNSMIFNFKGMSKIETEQNENGFYISFTCRIVSGVRIRVKIWIKDNKFKIKTETFVTWKLTNDLNEKITSDNIRYTTFVNNKTIDVLTGKEKPIIYDDWDF